MIVTPVRNVLVIAAFHFGRMMMRLSIIPIIVLAGTLVGAPAAHAAPINGTVTLTQFGTSVLFDVVLNAGYRFDESAAGGGALFLFNDSLSGSVITNITATLNGTTVTIPGGLSGFTNISPPVSAGSAGTFTALIGCTVAANCDAASIPLITDLHFTVTNATLAQLEVANAAGNIFFANVFPPASVPEPATLGRLGLGFAG